MIKPAPKRRAVFLDRDDTLMVNVPYLGDPAQVCVFPEAASALRLLREAEFDLFVVSNQSGVGRGLITREQVAAVNRELVRQLAAGGPGPDPLTGFYHAFGAPGVVETLDRKPSPALLFSAAETHVLDLAQSYFIGDRLSDVECGINAGCRSIFLAHAESSRAQAVTDEDRLAAKKAHFVALDLLEAVGWILAQERQTK